MDLKSAAEIVSRWAKHKSAIRSIHFYGSRVKCTHCEGSDLDVAIEIIPDIDDSGGLATWICNCDQWEKELSDILPFTIHAEWNGGINTEMIFKALSEAKMLVYKK